MIAVRDYALNQLHHIIRKDPWVQAIMRAGGYSLDQLADRVLGIYYSENFERLTEHFVLLYERMMGITPTSGQTLEQRRAAIASKWVYNMQFNVAAIQRIADNWGVGDVIVTYEPGFLHIVSVDAGGVVHDLSGLKRAVEKMIPAHIVVDYGRIGSPSWTSGEYYAGE